jgi:hypothetical protein
MQVHNRGLKYSSIIWEMELRSRIIRMWAILRCCRNFHRKMRLMVICTHVGVRMVDRNSEILWWNGCFLREKLKCVYRRVVTSRCGGMAGLVSGCGENFGTSTNTQFKALTKHEEGAYEHGEATNRPRPPIERSKVLERPPFLTSTLARSLCSTRASPDRRIRPPLRP